MPAKSASQRKPAQDREAFALRQCLNYLGKVANDAGLHLSAYFIEQAGDAALAAQQPSKREIRATRRNDFGRSSGLKRHAGEGRGQPATAEVASRGR